jgi:mannose-6-phosphate isomerase-like protein (cupin superfamily)
MKSYSKTRFECLSGYLVPPQNHGLLSVRHSAFIQPWSDPDVHLHTQSDEIYLLLHGRLHFGINGIELALQPWETLCVRAGMPHGILGGAGRIEHFGFRAPSPDDRLSLGAPSLNKTRTSIEDDKEINKAWGFRTSLLDPKNRNCWLIGLGEARFECPNFLFAYLDYPTHDAANAGIGTRLRLHLHRQSWEYYVCLRGKKVLLVEDQEVTVKPGEMVEVRPGVRHNIMRREAPYEGITFRAPILDDKEEY